jgi:hypothetical protein
MSTAFAIALSILLIVAIIELIEMALDDLDPHKSVKPKSKKKGRK